MRKAFRADREFLTLSELEEFDASQDETREQPKRWSEGLVSFSKRSSDEEDEVRPKREGFLNFGRLLGRDDDSIPPDPFVVTDQDSDANDEEEDDSDDRIVVSVGSSKELPGDDAEPLVGDDWVTEMAASAAASDSRKSIDQSAAGISFNDIMAEFADDGEESEDLDSLADQLMAEHSSKSGSLDDVVADFSADYVEKGDIDQFELSPDMFLDDNSEPEDEVPVLSMSDDTENSFDEGQSSSQFEHPVPRLPDTTDELPTFNFEEPSGEIVASSDRRLQTAKVTQSVTDRQDVSDVFGGDAVESGSLWKNSTQATSWDSEPAPRRMNPRPQFGSHRSVEPAWDSVSSSQDATSFDRADRRQRPDESMSFASSPLLLPESEPGPHRTTGTLAQVTTDQPGTNDLSNDPFLNDFESPAEPAHAPAPPTNAAAGGVVAGFSPKMWVVLLGSVIILYLLFAPERQNSTEPSNR